VLPELFSRLIVGEKEDVALQNANVAEVRQASLDQSSTNSSPAASRSDCQMVKVSPATVVTAKDSADNSPF
jgi:hypothetical protein